MRNILVALIIATTAQAASAQSIYNPNPQIYSPYARPALSPYLNIVGGAGTNYYMQTLREYDFRNQLFRPVFFGQDSMSGSDPTRSPSYQAVAGYQSAEDWVNQRIRETQLSPSGHPAGFLMATPYYRLPNQRSFIPYGQGQQPR
jgi:hypothetical protein